MIYAKKDYEDNELETDFDIDEVAKKVERIIKTDDEFPYAGYSIDHKTNLIKFYLKTGDGKEFIAFDPATCSYHVQNDLWFSEFDESALLQLLGIFTTIRREDEWKQIEAMGHNYEQ